MRQLLGIKKVRKYRLLTGLPIIAGLVRGGTDHRVDLCLQDGTVAFYYPKTGELEKSNCRHGCKSVFKEGKPE